MRHIHRQPLDKVPHDEEFQIRSRAKALVDKWDAILNAYKEAGPGANGTPAGPSLTALSKVDRAEEDVPNGAGALPTGETHLAADPDPFKARQGCGEWRRVQHAWGWNR